MRAALKRLTRERQDRLLHAYQIASLGGWSKVPPWEKVLRAWSPREAIPDRKMSTEEIEDALDAWVRHTNR